MDNIFTVNAAYITAIAAILAPTITALIHSVKEYKISKMTCTIDTKLKLCADFSNSYSRCQYDSEKTGYALAFYKSTSKLIAVCQHRSVRRTLFNLSHQVLKYGASKETDKLYERCIQLLSKEF